MDAEIERAHEARVRYVEPQSLGDPEGRCVRLPANATLHESYETQLHMWQRGAQRSVLRTGALLPPPDPSSREPIVLWLLSAWNGHGRPQTLRDNESANVALAEAIADAGGEVRDLVATVAPDHSWVEDSLLFTGIGPDVVHRLALEFGQPAFVAMGFGTVTIVPTGLRDDVHLVTLESEELTVDATCPMRSDAASSGRCVMRGGPWTSSSIHAAAIWSTHRELMLTRLGCAPCGGGTEPILGGPTGRPVSLGDVFLPSRYGGYAW